MDNSAKRIAPTRRIEVRANHEGPGWLIVAIEVRPDGGFKETALNAALPSSTKPMAEIVAAATARCVEALTGVGYASPGNECGVASHE